VAAVVQGGNGGASVDLIPTRGFDGKEVKATATNATTGHQCHPLDGLRARRATTVPTRARAYATSAPTDGAPSPNPKSAEALERPLETR
jgi:hypothetical protein